VKINQPDNYDNATHIIDKVHDTYIRDCMLQFDANSVPCATTYDVDTLDSFDPSTAGRERRASKTHSSESGLHEYGLLSTADIDGAVGVGKAASSVSLNRHSTDAGTPAAGMRDIRSHGLQLWDSAKTPFVAWRAAVNRVEQTGIDLFCTVSNDLSIEQAHHDALEQASLEQDVLIPPTLPPTHTRIEQLLEANYIWATLG
jgi:hypothetical protein